MQSIIALHKQNISQLNISNETNTNTNINTNININTQISLNNDSNNTNNSTMIVPNEVIVESKILNIDDHNIDNNTSSNNEINTEIPSIRKNTIPRINSNSNAWNNHMKSSNSKNSMSAEEIEIDNGVSLKVEKVANDGLYFFNEVCFCIYVCIYVLMNV